MADLLPKTATSESARKALNAKTSNLPSLKQTAENAGDALSGNVDLQSNVKKVRWPLPLSNRQADAGLQLLLGPSPCWLRGQIICASLVVLALMRLQLMSGV